MGMHSTEFNYLDCEKIDGALVNAYVDAFLDEENPSVLHIDSTWGENPVDLTAAVKAAETITSLEIANDDGGIPTYLQYNREDGGRDCIHGDDLSRIISMHLLKDVDQDDTLDDGDVYIWNSNTNKFETFSLSGFVDNVNNQFTNLGSRVSNLESRMTTVENKISNIENTVRKPNGIPGDAVLAWGNRNLYSDYTGADLKDHGIFTHSTSTNLADDMFME